MAASAAVLVGGHSTRMGRDKALLVLDGATLLERSINLLSRLTDDLLVIGRRYSLPACPGIRNLEDAGAQCGPMGGIAAALESAAYDRVLVVSCDLPFLNIDLLERLIALAPDHDATVPRLGGRAQPLHSVYGKDARATVEAHMAAQHYRVSGLLPSLAVRWLDEDEIDDLDPDHLSFFNVNTVEEWEAAQKTSRADRSR